MFFHDKKIHIIAVSTLIAAGILAAGCGNEKLPDADSDEYRQAVASFYTGLAALQAGEGLGAEDELLRVTELVPAEPAAWANLGVFAMRKGDYELATERLEKAHSLAPDNSEIAVLLGRLASQQGQSEQAIQHFRDAVTLDPQNTKAKYALAEEIERLNTPESDAEIQRLMEEILQTNPGNLAVLVELARIAARRGDSATLQQAVSRMAEESAEWPEDLQTQLQTLRENIQQPDTRALATQVAFLRNMLVRLPAFRHDLTSVRIPAEDIAELITRFIRLPQPQNAPAPSDTTLNFAAGTLPFAGETSWSWVGAIVLTAEDAPSIVLANQNAVQPSEGILLPFPGGPADASVAPHAITGLDYNYDFRTDLAFAGSGGLRLYKQEENGSFTDVTAQTTLPADVLRASYTGVWAADLDMEGDLDLLLGVSGKPSVVFRNNGDGSFTRAPLFSEAPDLLNFEWGDFDADGDPDAATLNASGNLQIHENRRGGDFQAQDAPLSNAAAISVADINNDAVLDMVVLLKSGSIQRLSFNTEQNQWVAAEVAQWPQPPAPLDPRASLLFVADLDNNGAFDLLASTPSGEQVWLADTQGGYRLQTSLDGAYAMAVSELTGDGRLDLLGISQDNRPVLLVNQGDIQYHWKILRTRAADVAGDQRINPFGIGGEIELRSGLLFQKQPISEPVVHFGLGEHTEADVARIIWPNGNVQAEFDLASDQTVLANQRLKGSCPWLFTYDGQGMQFVTDFIWRSPLGLKINAQETAGIMVTDDWVKIRGDQLVARDGYYDVRITAELWETHFFDHVSLMVVDHPDGTEVFVDERFAFPPPELALHAAAPLKSIAGAWDDQGKEVTSTVVALDQQYLGGFKLGPYQGVAEDHYVEIDLGNDAPAQGPLLLVANGWLHPTDSSINVAISQGNHAPPVSLSVEVPDSKGGWVVFRDNLGSPSGKVKTILIDLEGAFKPDTPRRLRLRTTMEIYWDSFAWTTRQPQVELRTQHLQPDVAELRYRGFSNIVQENPHDPEIPEYHNLNGRTRFWRDLVGYYTRFGDVRELLEKVDDRYVIMNAGDEMTFQFPVPPAPPAGWTRDFVLIGDGWIKDGDYNTTFSTTVLPLPTHNSPEYDTPPTQLEDDPVYQRFPEDWQKYHTRYISQERFQEALLLK